MIKQAWIAPDGAGCYHFCYHNARLWPLSRNDQIRNILPRVSGNTGRQRRITTKETDRRKAQRLADEYEKASRTKRSLRQAQAVLDRLHEELSGERVVRTTFGREALEKAAVALPEV